MKSKPTSEFAQELSRCSGRRVSEDAVRRLERKGIVSPDRDPWGRRLFGPDDLEAALRYLGPEKATAA